MPTSFVHLNGDRSLQSSSYAYLAVLAVKGRVAPQRRRSHPLLTSNVGRPPPSPTDSQGGADGVCPGRKGCRGSTADDRSARNESVRLWVPPARTCCWPDEHRPILSAILPLPSALVR